MLLHFGLDSGAGVGNGHGYATWSFFGGDRNLPPGRSKFQRIADKVGHYLVNPITVRFNRR